MAKNKVSASLPTVYQKTRTVASDNGSSVRSTVPLATPSELKQQLSNLVLDIYLSGGERFIPLPPFVLIRVLPKDLVSESGLLVLPNQKQNKPVHEGIVLETYRPYNEEVVLRCRRLDGTYEEHIGLIQRVCPIEVGQRIAYPHYEGVPHKYLGDDYMLIRQSADQIKFPYCQCLGIVEYDGDRNIARQIRMLMQEFHSVTTSGASVSKGADPATVAK